MFQRALQIKLAWQETRGHDNKTKKKNDRIKKKKKKQKKQLFGLNTTKNNEKHFKRKLKKTVVCPQDYNQSCPQGWAETNNNCAAPACTRKTET